VKLSVASALYVLGFDKHCTVVQLAAIPFLAGDGFDVVSALIEYRQLADATDATWALKQDAKGIARHFA
jgi:hypothetical protein